MSEKKLTCGTIKGELVYTLYGVMDVTGTSYPTARRYLITGKIPNRKIGREFRVLESDLYEFMYNSEARKGVRSISQMTAERKPGSQERTTLLQVVSLH